MSETGPEQQPPGGVGLRIGELSERVGIGSHTLRAWERRYGLLRPLRTLGGYRLYGADDERRLRAVLALRSQGVPMAEAAAHVLAELDRTLPTPTATDLRVARPVDPALAFFAAMNLAVTSFDEAAAERALESLLQALPLAAALDEAVMPFLHELGRRWETGEVSVAQEHFATAMVKQRFVPLTLTRGAAAPIVVLAAPEGEHHDLPLVLFSALVSRAGCRTRMLGANTPAAELSSATHGAAALVLAATAEEIFLTPATESGHNLRLPIFIAGRGATAVAATHWGAVALPGSLAQACEQVVAVAAGRPS